MDYPEITPIKPPIAIEELEGSCIDELFYDVDLESDMVTEDELEPLSLGEY